MSTLVIADTVEHAKRIARFVSGPTIAASPRSIVHYHATRGRVLTGVMAHESVYPLGPAVLAELVPAMQHLPNPEVVVIIRGEQ